jgi:hypothetical protein
MRAQNKKSDLRNRAVDDKGAHEELVELVETFVEKYDWQKELEKHAVSGIFQLLEDVGFLEEVETFRTFKVCRAMLYYHLGMIVLDQET